MWRTGIDANIISAMADPDAAEMYLAEIESTQLEDLTRDGLDRALHALDAKVYASVVGAILNPEHIEHMVELRSQVPRGNGRMALKLLDTLHKHETTDIADRAAESAVEEKCQSVEQIEKWVSWGIGLFRPISNQPSRRQSR